MLDRQIHKDFKHASGEEEDGIDGAYVADEMKQKIKIESENSDEEQEAPNQSDQFNNISSTLKINRRKSRAKGDY